jgi:hypothetical protein
MKNIFDVSHLMHGVIHHTIKFKNHFNVVYLYESTRVLHFLRLSVQLFDAPNNHVMHHYM